LDETVNTQSEETVVENFEEIKTQETSTPEDPKTAFAVTYNQKHDSLYNAVRSMSTNDGTIYYYLMDFDENFAFIEKESWLDSGFDETYGRIGYTFDEVTVEASITGEWEEIFLTYLTAAEKASLEAQKANFATLTTDFEAYKATHSTENTDVEELRTFQSTTLAAERKEAEDEIFDKFDKQLVNNTEYETLKSDCGIYEISELEYKCFSILGKSTANFSLTPKKKGSIKIPVTPTSTDTAPYGGLFEYYNKK
jgi:hypothetical protein